MIIERFFSTPSGVTPFSDIERSPVDAHTFMAPNEYLVFSLSTTRPQGTSIPSTPPLSLEVMVPELGAACETAISWMIFFPCISRAVTL